MSISAGYAVVAAIWIAFSDATVASQLRSTDLPVVWVNMGKGLGFVALTGLYLFVLLRARLRDLYTSREQLATQQERFQLALSAAEHGLFDWPLGGSWLRISSQGRQLLGADPQDQPDSARRWLRRIHGADRKRLLQMIGAHRDGRVSQVDIRVRFRRWDGNRRWLRLSGRLSRSREDGMPRLLGVVRDVNREVEEEAYRRHAEAFLHSASEGVLVTDDDGCIVSVNPAFEKITGYSRDEVVGRRPSMLSSGRHDSAFYQRMWDVIARHGYWEGEIWNRRRDGGVYPEWLTIRAVFDDEGMLTHYVAVFSDISRLREAEAQLVHQERHDALTGLPNRRYLQRHLEEAVRTAEARGEGLTVMALDIDDFERINETLGHAAGDRLLKGVGRRLVEHVGERGVVGRFSGDQFLVIQPCTQGDSLEVRSAVERIIQLFASPFDEQDRRVFVDVSVGVSRYPEHGRSAAELLRYTDRARAHAKRSAGSSYAVYSASGDDSGRRLKLETGLRGALERDEFRLHFQPQLNLGSGRVEGFEALIRWQHPEHGLLSPAEFLPIAEGLGLMARLDRWALQAAMSHAAEWRRQGYGDLRVAVNLSGAALADPRLVAYTKALLSDSGLPAGALELELTEGELMDDPESVAERLEAFYLLGIHLAVDDFGTGYSSLSYLQRFPLHRLKIDKSFVSDIGYRKGDGAIARAVIALAHGLSLDVVAEGVETELQRDMLREWGCEVIQGFGLARPMPAAEVAGWLDQVGRHPWLSRQQRACTSC